LREAATLKNNKEVYTVAVFVKGRELLFTPGSFLTYTGHPYHITDTVDNQNEPVMKIVYNNMKQTEYEELCRQLNNCPNVLAIQKEQ